MSERGPVGGAGELTAAIERLECEAAAHLDLPDNQFARDIEAVCIALRAALAAKAPQGVPLTQIMDFLDESTPDDADSSYWAARAYQEIGKRFLREAAPSPPVPGSVSDDTIHHGMVAPADEYNLRAYKVEGHWYVDIDIDKAHSGVANGFTLSEAMDSASEMLRHMRNTAIEEGGLPREAAAPKPAPARPEGCICSEAYGVGPEQCGRHAQAETLKESLGRKGHAR